MSTPRVTSQPAKSVAVQMADVMIQAPAVLDTLPIPGPIVAAQLDMARELYGPGLVRFADPDAIESRARDLAGVADMLIDPRSAASVNAETGAGGRMADALVVVREGFLELGHRARAVAGRTNTYSIVAEGVR